MFVGADADAGYWRRYLAQTPVSAAESDQGALEDIRGWRNQTTTGLVDRIVYPERSDQIENFVGQFFPSDLCRLLREVADRVGTQSAAGWEHRCRAPGITAVWRMMHIKRPLEKHVHRTVVDIVERYAPIHLPLAQDVAYFFASSNPRSNLRITHFMSDAQQQEVRRQLRDALAANFTGEGAEQRLAGAVKDGAPLLIRWIAYSDEDDRTAVPCDRWAEFSSTLLSLAETEPTIGIPLVVGLITKTQMKFGLQHDETGEVATKRQWVGEFDAEAANRHPPSYAPTQFSCVGAIRCAALVGGRHSLHADELRGGDWVRSRKRQTCDDISFGQIPAR